MYALSNDVESCLGLHYIYEFEDIRVPNCPELAQSVFGEGEEVALIRYIGVKVEYGNRRRVILSAKTDE